ncbi:MAG: glutamyl-tRNA reductase [Streptosporangiaceae bacterium]
MSVLVVGLSHKGAPLATLERVALTGDPLEKLLHDVARADDVAGALALSTCNRVEIYAEVDKFHGAVADICELLSRHSHVPSAELTPCLYVHYEDRAVQHLLAVACGLDSMVVGESQILGQLRQALRLARERGTLGRTLSDLGSLALRAGKRAQSETSIGAAGASLVTVGLQVAARNLAGNGVGVGDSRGPGSPPPGLAGKRVLVIGAGAMSGLAVASLAKTGAARLVIASRTRPRAQRLAASAGGQVADMADVVAEMAAADLVVTCTGASGHVITVDMVDAAMRQRQAGAAGSGLVLLDLAMPRDVEPAVATRRGVALTDLQTLAADGHPAFEPGEREIGEVRRIMADELAAYTLATRAATVTPTVVALRAKAAKVVDAELARLASRLGRLDAEAMDEVAKSMRRVTDKLLHDPTVRVKELAGAPGADTYDDALRVLFDLDPAAVQAVAQADAQLAGWPQATTDRADREER